MKYKARISICIVMTVICLLLAYAFVIEPAWIEIKRITITDPDIPPSFRGMTIAFLTDIHHGPLFPLKGVKKVVELVNNQHPDIILLGGDYVHRDKKYILPCFNELRALQADKGVFGVLGNHDHWESKGLTHQGMKEAGIRLLDNRGFRIYHNGERIKIGGVGDLFEDKQDTNPTVGDTVNEDFVILVSHNPDFAEYIQTDKVDIMLSGHTHGGQVTIFGLYAPFIPSAFGQRYRTGIIKSEKTLVIISNGIGTISPRVRFFCRPQIIMVHLE